MPGFTTKLCTIIGALTFLSGCASSNFSFPDWFAEEETQEEVQSPAPETSQEMDSGIRYRAEMREKIARTSSTSKPRLVEVYRTPKTLFSPTFSHKTLSDYAEQISMQLMHNGADLPMDAKIGVASFVEFDSSLNRSSALGNQLAELLIAEVQSYGVKVVDFKATSALMISPSGDFTFSRNAQRLASRSARIQSSQQELPPC